MTETASMMIDDKGEAYVAEWPHRIADGIGISVEHLATALHRVTGAVVNQMAFYPRTALPQIAELSPAQAKAVVAAMRTIRDEITSRQDVTHCRTCGLRLSRSGECDECQ
jgi:hypothetical protein